MKCNRLSGQLLKFHIRFDFFCRNFFLATNFISVRKVSLHDVSDCPVTWPDLDYFRSSIETFWFSLVFELQVVLDCRPISVFPVCGKS